MEQFKLSNLRELSTEEQLRLHGGANADGCSSCGKCSCSNDIEQVIKDEVRSEARKKQNK